ncbi:MAG: hypothetical protein KDI83_07920 [Gammaproteobacteria bacterium]|nr:hypothetical protein [Gammaproteobacteria bacterium]MCP5417645.1 hypothetical protein [Chromatiaceae bacterium]
MTGSTTDSTKYNWLDREGFTLLLDLHTQSVKSQIIQLFEDTQKPGRQANSQLSEEFLVTEIKRIIYESRARLSVFKVDGIPDLVEFLAKNLPAIELNRLIHETVKIVLSSGDSDEQRKRAIQYVKHTQIGLLRELNSKIFHPGF